MTYFVDKLSNICPVKGKYKMYSYEGRKSKSANAVVVGTCFNRHIFISDYFIESAAEEEFLAILCHECGHIEHYDLEKRIIFADIAVLSVFVMGYILDYVEIGILGGIMTELILFICGLLTYKKMQQKQELRADQFSVSIIGEKVYIEAIEKLYRLNDSMKKHGRIFSLLSTHPQLKERIHNLCNSSKIYG